MRTCGRKTAFLETGNLRAHMPAHFSITPRLGTSPILSLGNVENARLRGCFVNISSDEVGTCGCRRVLDLSGSSLHATPNSPRKFGCTSDCGYQEYTHC